MSTEHDYDLKKKVKIKFKGMDYFVMPRYKNHYLDNDYERFSLEILKNNLGPDSLFVDIGAHYGAYSLYAAQASGSEVIAIEPVDENFILLNENIKQNSLGKKIKSYQYAASDENTKAEFNIPWASDSAGFYEHTNAQTIRKQKVTVKKIDDVIGERRADVIKIDTEGHELSVIKGLSKTLTSNPHLQLIIEINPPMLERAGTDTKELLEYVVGLGKEIYMVSEDNFTLHRITDQIDSYNKFLNEGNYANLYCVPKTKNPYLMYISHTAQLGGAEMVMCEQIVQLRKKGILSHVVLPSRGPIEKKLIKNGVGYTVIEGYSFWAAQPPKADEADTQRTYGSIKAAKNIEELAKTIGATTVINNSVVNPWGYLAAKANDLPLVWMVHEFGDIDHGLEFDHHPEVLRNFIVAKSDLVVCCSDAVKKSITDATSIGNKKIHTVYYPYNPQNVIDKSNLKPEYNLPKKKSLRIIIVGTISEAKGQITAVKAISQLKNQKQNVELLLVGSSYDGYLKHVKNEAKKLGVLENITFLGFQENPYVYVKESDVFILTSRNEAFGRVTAEAMMLRVPVIATNSAGTIEMIEDGVTGILFEAGDSISLENAIKRFNSCDVDKMTDRAYKKITTMLDENKNTNELHKLLENLELNKQTGSEKILAKQFVIGLDGYKKELLQQKSVNEGLRQSIYMQANTNKELDKMLSDLKKSRSWKVTKPLRKSSNIIKKLRNK